MILFYHEQFVTLKRTLPIKPIHYVRRSPTITGPLMSLRPTLPTLKAASTRVNRSLRYRVKVAEGSQSEPPRLIPSSQVRLPRPYTVSRSSGGSLPVYSEARNDGTWKTIIRKVQVCNYLLSARFLTGFDAGGCRGETFRLQNIDVAC